MQPVRRLWWPGAAFLVWARVGWEGIVAICNGFARGRHANQHRKGGDGGKLHHWELAQEFIQQSINIYLFSFFLLRVE